MAGFADGYVPVNERIEAFYKAHPEGSVQCDIHTLTDALVVMRATVYRSPDDPRPSIAHSMLGIPGRTNFTRGSEIENAETSAVGRAIAMLGFEVKRGMASREEVWNKHTEEPPSRQSAPAVRERVDRETGEIEATAQAGGGSAVSTSQSPTGTPDGRMAAVMAAMKRIPEWAKGDAALAKEAAAIALNARPAEINKDVLPEYVAVWLEQPGNSPAVFASRYQAHFDAEQKRREAAEGAMAGG